MERTWESFFYQAAVESGHSEEFINICLNYGAALHKRNLPVIFDGNQLRIYFGEKFNPTRWDYSNCYKRYDIRKRSGGVRHIAAPFKPLLGMQEWILHNILEKILYEIPECANGFMKGRSIKTNAEPHANKKWLINVDIKNFFGSIRRVNVNEFFSSLGYEKEVTACLTAICTYKEDRYFALPQGAPTSPLLSNFISIKMDKELLDLANRVGASYTRYADDITFSGNDNICPITLKQIKAILSKYGFLLNKEKTRVRYQGCRMEVTGLTISNGVHVSKQYRKEVWRELHFLLKYGPEVHCAKRQYLKGYYKEWLQGRIMFIRSIDKEVGDKMQVKFKKINWIL